MSKGKQIDQKQVVQMARDICFKSDKPENCKDCDAMWCKAQLHAFRAYKAGYRKQSEAAWISVEERLPDCEYGSETEALLFRLKTGTVEAGYFGTGGIFRDKYFRCYHHASEGWDAKDVTHWMPLPEPPKGEHNE